MGDILAFTITEVALFQDYLRPLFPKQWPFRMSPTDTLKIDFDNIDVTVRETYQKLKTQLEAHHADNTPMKNNILWFTAEEMKLFQEDLETLVGVDGYPLLKADDNGLYPVFFVRDGEYEHIYQKLCGELCKRLGYRQLALVIDRHVDGGVLQLRLYTDMWIELWAIHGDMELCFHEIHRGDRPVEINNA
jgi:hypothetical protein